MKIPTCIRSKFPVFLVAALSGLGTGVNHAAAQGWTIADAPSQPWTTVASSADGIRLAAAGYAVHDEGDSGTGIYISSDSGATWSITSAPTNLLWTSIASSADGSKLVAVARGFGIGEGNQGIYFSSDSGVTWSQSAPSNSWFCVASSADGKKLVAVAGKGVYDGDGFIYTSSDSGISWMKTTAPNGYWASVASSGDGTKLVAVKEDGDTGDGNSAGLIYTSSDSGIVWTQTSAPSNFWASVASSADGIKLFAACEDGGNGGGIYASADAGVTWTLLSGPEDDFALGGFVASSADGAKLAAVAYDSLGSGTIYTSSDAGSTWSGGSSIVADWRSVALSADGSQLFAVAGGFHENAEPLIAVSPSTSRSSRLYIDPLGQNLNVSWLVPSSSYVLQQNLDLNTTNWIDVSTPPSLDFTNLRYNVPVSASANQAFYRLRHQ